MDSAKGLAILAVVAIHSLNFSLSRFSPGSLPWQLSIMADQVFRFCVPLFLAVTGYSLSQKFLKSPPSLLNFYASRLRKVLPLYFLFTAVYIISAHLLPGPDSYLDSFPLWQQLFLGRSSYHLYFVPLIVQFYLLFPLLFTLVRKNPRACLALAFVSQILVFRIIDQPGWNDQTQYFWYFSWLFYFVLGIYLSLRLYLPFLKFSPLLLASSLYFIFLSVLGIGPETNLIWATRFTRPVVFFYSQAIIILLLRRPHLINSPTLSFLGRHSYLIFLSHVLVLQLLFALN